MFQADYARATYHSKVVCYPDRGVVSRSTGGLSYWGILKVNTPLSTSPDDLLGGMGWWRTGEQVFRLYFEKKKILLFKIRSVFGPIFTEKNFCPIFQNFPARWRFWSEISTPDGVFGPKFDHQRAIFRLYFTKKKFGFSKFDPFFDPFSRKNFFAPFFKISLLDGVFGPKFDHQRVLFRLYFTKKNFGFSKFDRLSQ